MKIKQIAINMAALVVAVNVSADVLHTVDFEVEGEGYTSSINWTDLHSGSSSDYFMRAQNNQTSGMIPFNNIQGSYFWAVEDIDMMGDQWVKTTAINVSGYTSLTAKIALAADDDTSTFEETDFITLQYSIDGGGFTSIGSFRGWDPDGLVHLREDTNLDGVANDGGPLLTSTFTDYSYAIPVTGSQLQIRVLTNTGSSEELAFDNIVVEGVIPEPASIGLMAVAGALGFVFRKRLRR